MLWEVPIGDGIDSVVPGPWSLKHGGRRNILVVGTGKPCCTCGIKKIAVLLVSSHVRTEQVNKNGERQEGLTSAGRISSGEQSAILTNVQILHPLYHHHHSARSTMMFTLFRPPRPSKLRQSASHDSESQAETPLSVQKRGISPQTSNQARR